MNYSRIIMYNRIFIVFNFYGQYSCNAIIVSKIGLVTLLKKEYFNIIDYNWAINAQKYKYLEKREYIDLENSTANHIVPGSQKI